MPRRLTPARGKRWPRSRPAPSGTWATAQAHPSPQFFAVSFVFALQEIKKVKARALRAISAVFSSVLASEIWYGTTLLSRKSRRLPS